MNDVAIRPMQSNEWNDAKACALDAFGGEGPSIEVLLDALRASWSWIEELSFVAVQGNEVVGHVVYSQSMIDAPDRVIDVLTLAPMSVRSDKHGLGIGTRLIAETLEVIRETRPEPLVFVEGDPRFYSRAGFVAAGELGFVRPSLRIPEPAFQVFPLTDDLTGLSGYHVYPDVFWRTDSVGLR